MTAVSDWLSDMSSAAIQDAFPFQRVNQSIACVGL